MFYEGVPKQLFGWWLHIVHFTLTLAVLAFVSTRQFQLDAILCLWKGIQKSVTNTEKV